MTEVQRLHPDAECEKCPLYSAGTFVPSHGPAKAKIGLVGEAAGRDEVNEGQPFVGISGKLLNVVLKKNGVDRDDAFLTNATLCRPRGLQNTAPPPQAVAACRPRLVKELQDRGVEQVVAMGNTAAHSLLQTKEGITSLRIGPGKESPLLPGVKIIPTIHPAACLRSPDFYPSMEKDFTKLVHMPSLWEEPAYKVFDDVDQSIQVLDLLRSMEGEKLVLDIECNIEKDTGFDHPNQYEMLCIGLGYAKGKVIVIERNALQDAGVRGALTNLLKAKKLIAQNGKFDLAGLFPLCGALELWGDTMLASYCIDERRGIHALGIQGVEILGAPDWKHVLDKYNPKRNGYGVIPPEVLDKYNAFDVSVTWDLWEYYEPILDSLDLRRLHDHLIRASNQIMFMELNGIAINKQYNNELSTKYLESMAPLVEEMRQIIKDIHGDVLDKPFNPNSVPQVQKVFKLWDIHVDSTDKDTVEFLLEKEEKTYGHTDRPLGMFLKALQKYRREAKLYGTFVKGMRVRLYGGRVFPTFLLHGTTTGRLSCRNPNLQNIPRESIIREQFVPAIPGNVFVQTDMSQAELRVLTWMAREEYFRDIFNDPTRDLFNELRPRLYGDTGHLSPAAIKELRIRIKAYVYGLAYGREAGSIAAEFDLPMAEAVRGMQAFFGVIPNIVQFNLNVRKAIKGGRHLINPFGRHRRFHLITKQNEMDCYREGQAFLPQSTSSDIVLQAFTWARPKLKGKAFLRNTVHDSILGECKPEDADYVGRVLNELMLESADTVVKGYVQFATETKVGMHWGEV